MKIVFMSHTGSVTGGAEQCLLEYVDVLTRNGHTCKVIVPRVGEMTAVLTERNIAWTVVGFGWATRPHRKVNPHRILASTGNSLVRIFQEVEKFKPNLIITNTSVIPWGLYAGRAFNIPTMMLVHEILNDKDPSLNMVPSYEEYGKILNDNADYVLYNSEFVKGEFSDVLHTPKTSEHILYPLPPLDASKIDELYVENKIGKVLKIAIFGAVSPRKNQFEAVQAAKILVDSGQRDFTLDLYGDKEANIAYTKQLRRYIADNGLKDIVKIKGFTTGVYAKMNEYNVVLSTATYEPFGRTIVEGQLYGRVAVTNSTGGGPELVEDGVTGLVYELGDVDQLASRLRWIIDHKSDALELGRHAKAAQFQKYLTSSRYDALLDAVKYFEELPVAAFEGNIYDPALCLFQYNHQLNNRYKYVYRLLHNRITYKIKHLLTVSIRFAKRVVKSVIS